MLEFLLHRFISETFLISNFVTSAMKGKCEMAAQDLQKNRHRQTVFSQEEKVG